MLDELLEVPGDLGEHFSESPGGDDTERQGARKGAADDIEGERARLVERLIASLDADPDVEDAWAAEVERRNAEIESGAVDLVSGPEALAKLKSEFR